MSNARAIDYQAPEAAPAAAAAACDEATGLPGPALFEREGTKDLAFARRHCKEMALLYFQLDGLAAPRPARRRPLGDVFLQQFVYAVRRSVRIEDTLARLDESRFAVLSRECNAVAARMLTRRILANLRKLRGSHESLNAVSVGIATPRAYRCQAFGEYMELASQCLAKAVAHGGGRVVVARTEDNLRKLKTVSRRSGTANESPALGTGTSQTQNLNIAMWLIEEGFIDQIEPEPGSAQKFAPMLPEDEEQVNFDLGEVRVQLSRSA